MNASHVKKAAVIGAGVMGHSIAQVYATAGIKVRLADVSEKALERARGLIEMNLSLLAEHKRIQKKAVPEILGRIRMSVDIREAVKDVDITVEAVKEEIETKKGVFALISDNCPESAVIASNTSGLDVFTLADVVKNPSRLIIQHWYCPAHIIPLVEIVAGEPTSPETIKLNEELMKRLGKKSITLKQFFPSFIVNRIQGYIAMAFFEIIQKGWATAEEIDLAVKASLGVRLPIVGIVQSQDFTGLDLVNDVQKANGVNFPCISDRVARGDLGAKTGRGFYDYGGRSEAEILRKRDELYLKMSAYMEEIKAYDPV